MLLPRNRSSFVALIFCLQSAAHGGDSATAQGTAILEQARVIVQSSVDQAFRQSGRLIVLTGQKPVSGEYSYTSAGSLWRDELTLPGYSEVRVGTGNDEKIQRTFDYSPLAIYATLEAARAIKWLQLLPDEQISKVRSEKFSKRPTRCIDIKSKLMDRSVCV